MVPTREQEAAAMHSRTILVKNDREVLGIHADPDTVVALRLVSKQIGIARRSLTQRWEPQNTSFSASWAERGPPIWYSGLRPPLSPPAPIDDPSICVACPNNGEAM